MSKNKVIVGDAFDLDKYIDGAVPVKNRIEKIGYELEGGWVKIPIGAQIDRDGSVFARPELGRDDMGRVKQVAPDGVKCSIGEVQLGPMIPAGLAGSIKKYYPQIVDSTCGLHVHMSFATAKLYGMLMDGPEYQNSVFKYLMKWAESEGFPADHHIWPRLKGENEYCQKKFWPEKQIKARKDFDHGRVGNRYTGISYRWQYTKTIECRILPMFEDYKQAIRAINVLFNVTNASLLVMADREKVKGDVVLSSTEQYEEFIEEVFKI